MTEITNPLMSRVNKMPGETIRLPSLGRFYTNGELSEGSVNGEILLNPMTMTDEIMMKSPDFLFQGIAIDRVFRRCSPNILKPMDLLSSDVDFILTHLRRISFGPKIEIPFTCANPDCKHEQEVNIPLEYFTQSVKELDIEHFDEKFTVRTESDDRLVTLKPITFREFLIIQQVNVDSLNDPEFMEDYALDTYASIIKSVDMLENNSEQNRAFIKEWLNSIPRGDAKIIADAVNGIQDWGMTFSYKAKCTKCKKVNELSTELNPTAFFIQPSNPKTQN
jgi:hypothetical protein